MPVCKGLEVDTLCDAYSQVQQHAHAMEQQSSVNPDVTISSFPYHTIAVPYRSFKLATTV